MRRVRLHGQLRAGVLALPSSGLLRRGLPSRPLAGAADSAEPSAAARGVACCCRLGVGRLGSLSTASSRECFPAVERLGLLWILLLWILLLWILATRRWWL